MLIIISDNQCFTPRGLDLSPVIEAPASYNLYGIFIGRFGDQLFGRVAENVITRPPAANLHRHPSHQRAAVPGSVNNDRGGGSGER